MPIPAEPPAEPKKPEPPKVPGEPAPIPKAAFLPLPKSGERGYASPARERSRRVGQAPPHPNPLPEYREREPSFILADDGDPADPPPEKPFAKPTPNLPAAKPNAAANTAGEVAPTTVGNAVYQIASDGLVTELLRIPAVVYAVAEHDGKLTLATGSEGQVYELDPAAGESSVIAKVDSKDVTALLRKRDGRLVIGLSNGGEIGELSENLADAGTYISPVLDATQVSRFGTIHLLGSLPKETSLKISTRTGNVKDADDATWSEWSEEAAAAEFVATKVQAARFFQYRLSFASTDGKGTPTVRSVDVAYMTPNLAPAVKTVTLTPGDDKKKLTISWEASDPNGDALRYRIDYRVGIAGEWTIFKTDLTEATAEWDTRTVPDGRYQIRVTAADALANAAGLGKTGSRVSAAHEVDNTAPAIGDVKSSVDGKKVVVDVRVVDRETTVAMLEYSVDSSKDWQSVLPADMLADSPQEAYHVLTGELSPGPHVISLRATDCERVTLRSSRSP